ncbi:MAG: UDP-N-acetylmuramate dehydrogenase [Candidatus Uhrbacteria bacterium]
MTPEQITTTLRERFGEKLRENEPLAARTNFRVGGPARWFVDVLNEEELRFVLALARDANIPHVLLGGGTNVLVADEGFPGVVIRLAMRSVRVDGNQLVAGAGTAMTLVAQTAADAGLSGLEWAASLPGTIGGAVRGNAGCFGGSMADVVCGVGVFDARNSTMLTMDCNACNFAYRTSQFKREPHLLILEVACALHHDDADAVRARGHEVVARRCEAQPAGHASAGCLFKNVDMATVSSAALKRLEDATHGTWRDVVRNEQLSAGWIVDLLGMKGAQIGKAQVSPHHGNFIVNLGGACAADIAALVTLIKDRALQKFGIALEEEVQRIGFTPMK